MLTLHLSNGLPGTQSFINSKGASMVSTVGQIEFPP